jgi:hypothetical protein
MRVERSNRMKAQQSENEVAAQSGSEEWLEQVRRQVGSLRFGVVQVVVHDSRVVQIEKTEKIRFEPTAGTR